MEHQWPLLSPGNAIFPFPWPRSLLINSLHIWQLSSSVFDDFLFPNLPQKNLFPSLNLFFLGELSLIHIFKHHFNYRSPGWPPVLQIKFYWSTARLIHCYAAFSLQWQSWVVVTENVWHATPKTFTTGFFNKKFADTDLEHDWLSVKLQQKVENSTCPKPNLLMLFCFIEYVKSVLSAFTFIVPYLIVHNSDNLFQGWTHHLFYLLILPISYLNIFVSNLIFSIYSSKYIAYSVASNLKCPSVHVFIV